MTSTADHECRSGRRCVAATTDEDGHRTGAGILLARTLCDACVESSRLAIAQLADDHTALNQAASEPPTRRANAGPRVSYTPDRNAVPVSVGALSTASAIDTELWRWGWRLDPAIRRRPPRNPSARVQLCHAIITARFDELVALPLQRVGLATSAPDGSCDWATVDWDGVNAVQRLARLHRATQGVLGTRRTVTWMPDPCPQCSLRALTFEPTADIIACRNCETNWGAAEFNKIGHMEAA